MPTVGTINQRIQLLAEEKPQDKCYYFIGVKNEILTMTRQQLFDLSRRYANRLRRNGVKTGDVIGSVLTNSRTRILTDLAIMMAGGVVLNTLPVLSDGQDFFESLRNSNCSVMIVSSGSSSLKLLEKFGVFGSVVKEGSVETIIAVQCSQAPCLKQLIVYKLTSHQDHTAFISSLADEDFYKADVNADDEAYIFLTSGSTGFSKMVPRTHGECLAIAENHKCIFTPDDILYSDRPFGWIGGFPNFFYSQGIPTVVQELFDGVALRRVKKIWDIVLDLGATFTFMPVPDVLQLKQCYDKKLFSRPIRVIFTGGQPIRKNVIDAVGQVCEVMLTTYGSTDAGLISFGQVTANDKESFKDCYAGNVITPGLELRLVDEHTKEPLIEANRVGIIHLKGKTVLRRYLNVEASTTGTFTEDGWLDTNDAGYMDEKGGLNVIGRQSDVIVNGPYNVYPQWMEERIQRCQGVGCVMIVGLPHPVTTQELCVCVIKEKDSTLTLADLETFCKGMFLDGACKFGAVPEKFVFMDSFPLLATGKVSRKEVEKLAVKYFQTVLN